MFSPVTVSETREMNEERFTWKTGCLLCHILTNLRIIRVERCRFHLGDEILTFHPLFYVGKGRDDMTI